MHSPGADMEKSEETRRIELACKHATEDALRKLREAGLPRTYIRGDEIVEEWPDGTEKILKKVHCP